MRGRWFGQDLWEGGYWGGGGGRDRIREGEKLGGLEWRVRGRWFGRDLWEGGDGGGGGLGEGGGLGRGSRRFVTTLRMTDGFCLFVFSFDVRSHTPGLLYDEKSIVTIS